MRPAPGPAEPAGPAALPPLSAWQRAASIPFIVLIKVYQYTLSPIVGRQCRFHPTCSWYALEAYRVHGPVRGTVLTLGRLWRCAPWGKGGYDPVPLRGERRGAGGVARGIERR